ncbi:hypothetical protein GUITHDRAFT_140319 [Guillardia theta CCMP2712]|uniref:Uncharacterized protein n=1 Tax=Guillardia theta (strain CCMP2712) TaxID=905079 RepID=L1J627_GUITC|nr:hypothetical protein GUITHDRAFT_140319 [Guillardia theta CCMP2712]EKX43545.1 hypothetical protein GUITHDRAFT_140319 [Guillardia theta CCMP2712]|eukprot:XP_005830525.1 hypothetical protein GUITHDRAFT_140319 [Guillardia theta CCMP2712]
MVCSSNAAVKISTLSGAARQDGSWGNIVISGTHDEPINKIRVWNAGLLGETRHANLLMKQEDYSLNASVSCIESIPHVSYETGVPLWVGTRKGSVYSLHAQLSEARMDSGEDESLELWGVSHGEEAYAKEGAGAPLHSCSCSAISLDPKSRGMRVLSAGEDGNIFEVQRNSSGGLEEATMRVENADWVSINDLKFDSQGDFFFTAGSAGGLKMWSSNSKDLKPKTFDNAQRHNLVAIQPFGSYVIAGCEEGPILVYDIRNEKSFVSAHASEDFKDGFHKVLKFVLFRGRPVETRYSQAVNDVGAVICDKSQRDKSVLCVAAADTGILIGQRPSFV